MRDRNCSVPGCERDCLYVAYCAPHYRRWKATGNAQPNKPLRELPSRSADIVDRLMAKSRETAEGCIEWTGDLNRGGYGRIGWQGKQWMTHRVMWTVKVGPIPTDDDWTIDHLCRNRACMNVEHLEVVTRTENTRRGGGLEVAQALNRTRSHCPNGHRYTPDTIYVSTSGQRMCKVCKGIAWRKSSPTTGEQRRRKYRERREAGATTYQALFVDWENYPPKRPA